MDIGTKVTIMNTPTYANLWLRKVNKKFHEREKQRDLNPLAFLFKLEMRSLTIKTKSCRQSHIGQYKFQFNCKLSRAKSLGFIYGFH